MMQKLFDFFCSLQFIFRPSYWIMLGKYSKAWDKQLQQLAKEHDFVPVHGHAGKAARCMLGDHHMWLGNYPYSFLVAEKVIQATTYSSGNTYFNFATRDLDHQPRPSRLTIMRLRKKIVDDFAKHNVILDDK